MNQSDLHDAIQRYRSGRASLRLVAWALVRYRAQVEGAPPPNASELIRLTGASKPNAHRVMAEELMEVADASASLGNRDFGVSETKTRQSRKPRLSVSESETGLRENLGNQDKRVLETETGGLGLPDTPLHPPYKEKELRKEDVDDDAGAGTGGPEPEAPWEVEPSPSRPAVPATDETTAPLEGSSADSGPRYFDPDGRPIELPPEPDPDLVEALVDYCRERFPNRSEFPHEVRTVRRQFDLDCLRMAIWKASRSKNVRGFGLIRTIAREFEQLNRFHWPRPEETPEDPPPIPEQLLGIWRSCDRIRAAKAAQQAQAREDRIRDAVAASRMA